MIYDTQSDQISQKQDERNLYAILCRIKIILSDNL